MIKRKQTSKALKLFGVNGEIKKCYQSLVADISTTIFPGIQLLQPAVLLCNSDSSALIINDNSLQFYLKLNCGSLNSIY